MCIPIIIVLISCIVPSNAQYLADSDYFGFDGCLPAVGIPLLGLLLLLGLSGGGLGAAPAPAPAPTPTPTITLTPSTPCPPCPTPPTMACPTSAACTPKPDCPPGFQRLGGILTKCYSVTASGQNYFEAEAACYAMGGNLAEFSNAAEQAAVQAFVNGLPGEAYVGYNDCQTDDTLVGDDSRAAITPAFGGAVPTRTDCGLLAPGNVLLANDCTNPRRGICEIRVDPALVRCVCA